MEIFEGDIHNYENLKNGVGSKARNALTDYTNRLSGIGSDGFNNGDNSTAHAVIDELAIQMGRILTATEDVDSMIDDLVFSIKAYIIEKEDRLAESIMED